MTRQSPTLNLAPARPLSFFTSPWPVSAKCCSRPLTRRRTSCESFNHWVVARGMKVIRFMRIYRIMRYFGQAISMAPQLRTVAILFLALAALTGLGGPAFAVQPDEILKDSVLESRARALSQELRCMVCQNQSID